MMDMSLKDYRFSCDDAIKMITRMPMLRKIFFQTSKQGYAGLRSHAHHGWILLLVSYHEDQFFLVLQKLQN